jgi:hypothetical protein
MSDNPFASPSQPGPGGFNIDPKGAAGPKPKNYLVESIVLLLCCGGVFAIPAIIFAAQVDSKYNAGDYRGAVESSNQAKKWCIIAVCLGVGCGIIVGGLQVGLAILGAAAEGM